MVEKINVKHALIHEDSVLGLVKGQVSEQVKDVRFLSRGLNDTYKITGKESCYAYRIYRHGWRNEAAIKFELDAILYLKNKGYEAVGPVQETGGLCVKKIVAPEGDRYGVLFSPGATVRKTPTSKHEV
ncbi:hypothetical protein ACTWPF_13895 [Oceanobacillus sp. M65]|uniref:hypothetical protein n=1 Tax=Oceanobacillus sp. M65 TaxID=3457435 RepID=UPI003FCEC670